MALPNPIPAIQGSNIVLGPAVREETFLIVPGTSDYVNTGTVSTSGYIITALSLRFLPTNGIMCAWISGMNTAAAGYVPQIWFPIAQIGAVAGGAGFEGYSQLNFQVYQSGVESASAAPLAQLPNGTNLTGAVWFLTVRGQ